MSKEALVEKYRLALVNQGYAKDEIEATVNEFKRVIDIREDSVPTLLSILTQPALNTKVVEPAGRRINPDAPLAQKKPRPSRAKGSHKKKYLAPIIKRAGGRPPRPRRKPSKEQNAFNHPMPR